MIPGPRREEESERGAAGREHETFDEELLRDPPPCGAERDAESQFVPAPGRCGEQEVGDRRARRDEQQADETE